MANDEPGLFPSLFEDQLKKIICCCQPETDLQTLRTKSPVNHAPLYCGIGMMVAKNSQGVWIVSSMVPEGMDLDRLYTYVKHNCDVVLIRV